VNLRLLALHFIQQQRIERLILHRLAPAIGAVSPDKNKGGLPPGFLESVALIGNLVFSSSSSANGTGCGAN
jgi:hypothetical protein